MPAAFNPCFTPYQLYQYETVAQIRRRIKLPAEHLCRLHLSPHFYLLELILKLVDQYLSSLVKDQIRSAAILLLVGRVFFFSFLSWIRG
jgi:hypothetical protein